MQQQIREIPAPSADILFPGVHWHDFIRAGVERGQYLDAIGQEEEWLEERMQFSSLGQGERRGVEFQQSDGRWYHAFSQETRQGGYVGIRIDITESKMLELALRESEELVRQILEASPVPIAMVRLDDARILYEARPPRRSSKRRFPAASEEPPMPGSTSRGVRSCSRSCAKTAFSNEARPNSAATTAASSGAASPAG